MTWAGGLRRAAIRALAAYASPPGQHRVVLRMALWLQFVLRHGRPPRPDARRFNDFLHALRVSGELGTPARRRISDKLQAKALIVERLGTARAVPTLAVLRTPEALRDFVPTGLPAIVKPSHSSGRTKRIDRPSDFHDALPLFQRWLNHDYFRESLEENYAGLERTLLVEPCLDERYAFEGSVHVRAGRARVVSIIQRFDPDKRRASVDRDWRALHVALGQPYLPMDLAPPPFAADLLRDAETLARDFSYLRVDFYASRDDYVFGELTNLPGGGLSRFSSPEGEARFNAAFFSDDH